MTTNEFMSPWFYLIDAENGRQGVGVGFLFMNLFLCHNNLLYFVFVWIVGEIAARALVSAFFFG